MTERELETALAWLRGFMDAYEAEIIALARGRFALGLFLYPRGPMYRKSREELAAEIVEEIADAIVYAARRLAIDTADPVLPVGPRAALSSVQPVRAA